MKKSKRPLLVIVGSTLLVILVVLGIVAYFAAYLPYTRIRAKAEAVMAEADGMKAEFKKNDIELVAKKLENISMKYAEFEKEAQTVYWASFIPHVVDFKNGVEAGRYVIHAGQESVKAIEPYADLIGFSKTKKQNFYEKSAEERLQTAVLTLDKMLQKIDVVSKDIEEAEKRIATIDPKRYPEKFGDKEVRSNIVLMKDQFQGMASLFVDAKPFLKELPEIFGANKEKTYLILFQNTAEQRASGGFLTFYAVFQINKGKITIDKSSDIYDLDNNIASHPAANEKIKLYHKDVTKTYIRDSNISPDFVESMKLFDALYQKAGNKVKYDGIIAMDSKVLVDMLTIFGDTQVSGINFSAKEDERCDCPQVIYTLFDIVDRPVGYIKVDRKRILGNLMLELFYKAVGFSPSKYWGPLAETMFKNMDEKHIQLYFVDKDIQGAVEKLNYAGRIRDYEGDYLHINNVNFAGAKSNLFVTEKITSKTTFSGGQIQRDVTIEFKNPYKHSDCNSNKAVAGLCLNATLRNWIRFYVPKGSKLVSLKGSQKPTQTYDELGKTVFEGFMTVNPEGKAIVNVTYTLPSSISKDDYKLMIQKQAGEENQEWIVQVDGKQQFNGILMTDEEIK